jgi:hypothetical protein
MFSESKSFDLKKRCDLLLAALLNNKQLEEKWWNSHNKYFNECPADVFSRDPNYVYDYLMRMAEGEW